MMRRRERNQKCRARQIEISFGAAHETAAIVGDQPARQRMLPVLPGAVERDQPSAVAQPAAAQGERSRRRFIRQMMQQPQRRDRVELAQFPRPSAAHVGSLETRAWITRARRSQISGIGIQPAIIDRRQIRTQPSRPAAEIEQTFPRAATRSRREHLVDSAEARVHD